MLVGFTSTTESVESSPNVGCKVVGTLRELQFNLLRTSQSGGVFVLCGAGERHSLKFDIIKLTK